MKAAHSAASSERHRRSAIEHSPEIELLVVAMELLLCLRDEELIVEAFAEKVSRCEV